MNIEQMIQRLQKKIEIAEINMEIASNGFKESENDPMMKKNYEISLAVHIAEKQLLQRLVSELEFDLYSQGMYS